MELLGPISGIFDPFLVHLGPLFGPKNDKKTPLARQMKLYRVMDGHRPQGRTLEGPWNICRAFGGILGALWGLFNPILTPFSPPILHNFWLMVAPVHVHVIRYICVQVLACDTEHGCQLKAETDSGHAHCRRPVFQCNTYRSSASESHTYGQLSTISRSSMWTLDKGLDGWVEG